MFKNWRYFCSFILYVTVNGISSDKAIRFMSFFRKIFFQQYIQSREKISESVDRRIIIFCSLIFVILKVQWYTLTMSIMSIEMQLHEVTLEDFCIIRHKPKAV